MMPDTRVSRSLLRPGIDIRPGQAFCLQCPWARSDDPQAVENARQHHEDTGHPTEGREPEREEDQDEEQP